MNGNINNNAPFERYSLASMADWDDTIQISMTNYEADFVVADELPGKVLKKIMNLSTTADIVVKYRTEKRAELVADGGTDNTPVYPLVAMTSTDKLPAIERIITEGTTVGASLLLYVQDKG